MGNALPFCFLAHQFSLSPDIVGVAIVGTMLLLQHGASAAAECDVTAYEMACLLGSQSVRQQLEQQEGSRIGASKPRGNLQCQMAVLEVSTFVVIMLSTNQNNSFYDRLPCNFGIFFNFFSGKIQSWTI